MSSISRVVLAAGAANYTGDVFDCTGLAHVHFYVAVAGTAVTGAVIVATTPDGQGNLSTAPAVLTPGVTGALVTTAPAGYALNATTVQIDLTAAAPGNVAFRISNPPQYLVPRFAYGSGGDATTVIILRAYGYHLAS